MQKKGRRKVDIRRLDAHDWRTYRDLRLASLIDSPRAFDISYAGASPRSDAHWQTYVESDRSIFAAFDHLRPCGLCVLEPNPKRARGVMTLGQMWVAAADRVRGIGSKLTEVCLAEAQIRGARGVVLEVADNNYTAMSIYERHGFVPTGRTTVLPGVGHQRIRELARKVGDDAARSGAVHWAGRPV